MVVLTLHSLAVVEEATDGAFETPPMGAGLAELDAGVSTVVSLHIQINWPWG